LKKLPIGIQSFVEMRTGNYYYVDKTHFVKKLVDEGKYFFLSRPRRFGKSLFLDTLKQAFLAKKELFKDLYLENNWDWSEPHPVIHISFGSGVVKDPKTLQKRMEYFVNDHAKGYGVPLEKEIIPDRFMELIEKLHKKYSKKVVILVDEYDKPILDNIENPDAAMEMREVLRNFYSVVKDSDEHIEFAFITGVTKFSKVSLFSGLNNLKDITLDPKYSTICGYTQEEFERVFKDRLDDVDLEEVKRWYNGYSWLGDRVYNPFDILLFLDMKDFRPFWFETGTPTFLIKLLMKEKYFIPKLEELRAGDEIVEQFDIDRINSTTLLFQTGYLTIVDVQQIGVRKMYTLRYPNLEVKSALTDHILNYLTGDIQKKVENEMKIGKALMEGNVGELMEVIKGLFASIPYDWYRKSGLDKYEGYYASVFYSYFAALGLEVRAEDATNVGKIDMSVRFNNNCYIFEFKVVEKEEGKALKQIKEKKYHEKYMKECDEICLIGIEFGKRKETLSFLNMRK